MKTKETTRLRRSSTGLRRKITAAPKMSMSRENPEQGELHKGKWSERGLAASRGQCYFFSFHL